MEHGAYAYTPACLHLSLFNIVKSRTFPRAIPLLSARAYRASEVTVWTLKRYSRLTSGTCTH